MHYKNGREAKNGDKIAWQMLGGQIITGVLYDATPGNDYCNGRIAIFDGNQFSPNLKECLRLDDVIMPSVTTDKTNDPEPK